MTSFDNMCREAAKRFIQTVAIIDDAVTYDMNETSHESKKETIKPPVSGLKNGKNDKRPPKPNKDSKGVESQADHNNIGLLDARVLINAFADRGIICCIQRPKHEESPLKRATKLASSVDVLVIDWALDKKDKSLPRDIVKCVLDDDYRAGGRMRLIIIYTAQSFIDQMLKDLEEDAKTVYDEGLSIDRTNFIIKTNDFRIVIFNKEGTTNPPRGARIVPFDQLPDITISEYAELVKGIVPGATLHSIAAMREKTHGFLSILNSNLDGAYCFHRALLPEPSDSVDFAMNLIAKEVDAVVQSDTKARQFVDRNGIKAWLNQFVSDDSIPFGSSSLSKKTIENCILNGQLSKKDGIVNIKKEYATNWAQSQVDAGHTLNNRDCDEITISDAKDLISQNRWEDINRCRPPNEMRFAEVFYPTPKKTAHCCNTLSHLQCTTRDTVDRLYFDDSKNPPLRLGTILRTGGRDSEKWYLCLTPLCDCVRLKEEANFLFLQLYSGKKDNADIIIKMQDGTFSPLIVKLKNKKIKLLTIPFKPTNGSDRIRTYRWQKE